MEVAALIAGLASALALVASLLFFAREARESARQTRVANEMAGLQAMTAAFEKIHNTTAFFMEYPDLRQYFDEGVEPPDASDGVDPHVRVRVLTLAELFSDSLETSLDAVRTIEAAGRDREDMEDYARFMLRSSPALRRAITAHPRWWPLLFGELSKLPAEAVTASSSEG